MVNKDFEFYLKAGDQLKKKSKWNEAVEAYKKAIQFRNDDFRIYERLGLICLKKGDYEQAVAYFSKAILYKPDRYLLYDRRGTAYSFIGDKENVQADFNRAIRLHAQHNVYFIKHWHTNNWETLDKQSTILARQ